MRNNNYPLIIVVCCFLLLWAGFSLFGNYGPYGEHKVENFLQEKSYSDIKVYGPSFMKCNKIFARRFSGKNKGSWVDGDVCCNLFSCTIGD